MCNGINELAGAVGKVLEVAPDLYDDALKTSAQETGKTLSRIPRLINAVLAPLDIWILNKEYNVDETKKLLAKKLENVEPEKIVPPEPYVAVPALQAISYSMNSEELRNMYANLIANSMNIDEKEKVHPAFVELIKQLSPFEARVLKSFSDRNAFSFPILKIRRSIDENDSSGIDYKLHIVEPSFGVSIDTLDDFVIAIENLIRLNIISVKYDESFTETSLYSNVKNSDIVLKFQNRINSYTEYNHCLIKEGILEITQLGISFIKICIS
jgi:hypothetical protein